MKKTMFKLLGILILVFSFTVSCFGAEADSEIDPAMDMRVKMARIAAAEASPTKSTDLNMMCNIDEYKAILKDWKIIPYAHQSIYEKKLTVIETREPLGVCHHPDTGFTQVFFHKGYPLMIQQFLQHPEEVDSIYASCKNALSKDSSIKELPTNTERFNYGEKDKGIRTVYAWDTIGFNLCLVDTKYDDGVHELYLVANSKLFIDN